MYVTTLESNVRSPDGKPYIFSLGRLTLLVGPNGSGKSTLTNAVRLPLCGTAALLGKDNVKDQSTLSDLLSPQTPAEEDGSHNLFSALTFDDGSHAAWGMVVEKDGSTKRPLHEPHPGADPEQLLALSSIWGELQGDPKAARARLLTWIGQGVSEEDVLATTPSHLHGKYRDIAEKQRGGQIDRLIATSEYVTRRAREIEADATAQDRLVAQLGSELTLRPTEDEIAAAKSAVEQWRALRDLARDWIEPPSAEEVATFRTARDEAQEAVRQWQQTFNGLVQTPEQVKHGWLGVILSPVELNGSGTCPACGATPGAEVLDAWSTWHFAQSNQDSPGLNEQRDQAAMALSGWKERLDRCERALSVAELRVSAMKDKIHPPLPSEDALAGLQAAETYLASLLRSAGNWDTVQRAKDTAAELRSSKPAYQELAAATTSAVTSLLDKLVAAFCVAVQRFLPERWVFGLTLRRGDREVFEMGFLRSGSLHTLLSDTELDALSVAVTMAVAEMGGGASGKKRGRKAANATQQPYYLVVPADRARDAETLGELVRAWGKFSGQVIVETPVMPKGRLGKDWTVVDVGAWRAGFERKEEKADGANPPEALMAQAQQEANQWAGEVYAQAPVVASLTTEDYGAMGEPDVVLRPPVDYSVALAALGYKPAQIEIIKSSPAGAWLVENEIPAVRTLFTRGQVVPFEKSGKPMKALEV